MQRSSRAGSVRSDLVTQVVAVDRHLCGMPVILTSESLADAPVVWSAARLVSRTSMRRQRRVLIVRAHGQEDITETSDVIVAWLPADIRMGDLVAMPHRLRQSS